MDRIRSELNKLILDSMAFVVSDDKEEGKAFREVIRQREIIIALFEGNSVVDD